MKTFVAYVLLYLLATGVSTIAVAILMFSGLAVKKLIK